MQKATDKVEMLVKENANLKKRVAEAASRQASPVEQPYHNAAYYIIFVIIGWLIAKFVIWFPALINCSYDIIVIRPRPFSRVHEGLILMYVVGFQTYLI